MSRPSLLLTILGALSACYREETTMCMDVADDATTCPSADEADPAAMFSDRCDLEAVHVNGPGSLEVGWSYFYDSGVEDLVCCYPVTAKDTEPRGDCIVGRPYQEARGAVRADTVPRPGWHADGAPTAPDALLAEAWAEAGALEHASVAAFARLTLELMAVGAPAELLRDVQRAAADEVEHARLAYGLASRFAGHALGPGPFPFSEALRPCGDLRALAVAAVREGCLGETVGAYVAARAAATEPDPAVRAVLETLAADESRHAALSWRIVAFALRTGDPGVREAVLEAFREAPALEPPPMLARGARYGGLDAAAYRAAASEALREVVAPAARALLAAPASAPRSAARA